MECHSRGNERSRQRKRARGCYVYIQISSRRSRWRAQKNQPCQSRPMIDGGLSIGRHGRRGSPGARTTISDDDKDRASRAYHRRNNTNGRRSSSDRVNLPAIANLFPFLLFPQERRRGSARGGLASPRLAPRESRKKREMREAEERRTRNQRGSESRDAKRDEKRLKNQPHRGCFFSRHGRARAQR